MLDRVKAKYRDLLLSVQLINVQSTRLLANQDALVRTPPTGVSLSYWMVSRTAKDGSRPKLKDFQDLSIKQHSWGGKKTLNDATQSLIQNGTGAIRGRCQ